MPLDCIFKAWGYVPKHRLCTKCEPLEDIFTSLGYDNKKKSKTIDNIFRAYTMMKADDVLRDEKSGVKKAAAKLIKRICGLRATEELKQAVKEADRTIRDLEASPIEADEYLQQISAIGGQVFQTSAEDEKAYPVGRAISAATTIHDMARDLEEDKRKELFNPLKDIPIERTHTVTADLLNAFLGNQPLLRGGPQTRVFSSQVVPVSGGFWETCFGVCAGICSALALFECCCR